MADRLWRSAVTDDHTLVDAVSALPDMAPVLAHAGFQRAQIHRRQVADRSQAPALEHLLCLRADAPEATELQRREEGLLTARRHDDEPIRLAQVRADLRAELVRRDADRQHQAELLAHGSFELARDVLRAAEEVFGRRHVEERLVERDGLD